VWSRDGFLRKSSSRSTAHMCLLPTYLLRNSKSNEQKELGCPRYRQYLISDCSENVGLRRRGKTSRTPNSGPRSQLRAISNRSSVSSSNVKQFVRHPRLVIGHRSWRLSPLTFHDLDSIGMASFKTRNARFVPQGNDAAIDGLFRFGWLIGSSSREANVMEYQVLRVQQTMASPDLAV
jgi:hypothetical protein